MINDIKEIFSKEYDGNPLLIKSPGRVNLIGEHTDYNDGFVLPASVNKAIYFAIAPNTVNQFRFFSYDLNEPYTTSVNDIGKCDKAWANYLLGVIAQFEKDGKKVQGFDCVFGGDVPIGAGMSSSAAIECGLAFAINKMQEFNYNILDLVKFSQKAEHEYAGVQCGIMDQFAVMHGKENNVIKLDCRSLEYEFYPFDMSDYLLILVNTGVKHELASSEYNKRRKECREGVKLMQKYDSNIKSLRDISIELIQKHKDKFNRVIYDRCTYVIEENIRVEKACNALLDKNYIEFGQQMYSSHYGLKDKYEVSCTELDNLVIIAENFEGVIGARMMGGGFGGCTINLVKKDVVTEFEDTIKAKYKTPEGDAPEIIEVVIEEGSHEIVEIK